MVEETTPIPVDNKPERILDIAMEVGLNLLRSGAEIARVEETITYICKAYGATHIDVFAFPTLVVGTIFVGEESYTTKVRRNKDVTINLYRIERLNELSRYICKNKPSLEEVREKTNEIKTKKDYNLLIVYLGAILTAFGFATYFGGSLRDGIASSLAGLVMMFFVRIKIKNITPMLHTLLCSLIGGLCCNVTCWLGLGEHLAFVMIGCIMINIPGLAISTSLKDIMIGDIVSGSVRFFQSIVNTGAIAAGFSIWTTIYHGSIGDAFIEVSALQLFVAGILGTVGFSIIFNNKYKDLPLLGLLGLIVSICYYFSQKVFDNAFLSVVLVSIVAAGLAELLARLLKAPVIIFELPAIILLVPGAMLFWTMYYIMNWNSELFMSYGVQFFLTSLAIGLGIIIVSVLVRVLKNVITLFKNKKETC